MTVEPREVAVRSLVSPPGFGTQDAVQNARAFLRDARDSGCQPVSDVRLRCPGFARVAGPVRPLGSGLGSLSVRGLARGVKGAQANFSPIKKTDTPCKLSYN